MNIIALAPLKDFWTAHPDSEQQLRTWVDEVKKADWQTPADIKAQYGKASILKNSRVVFNIKGNDYRLIVSVAYAHKRLFVKFSGTHKEYDRIDANTVTLEP